MDMEVSVPGSGFGEDGMSIVSVEVVAGQAIKVIKQIKYFFKYFFLNLILGFLQDVIVPQAATDTESTTLDIGAFSDTSQSLPGLVENTKKVNSKIIFKKKS